MRTSRSAALRRWLWFFGLWAGGLAVTAAVAFGMRALFTL